MKAFLELLTPRRAYALTFLVALIIIVATLAPPGAVAVHPPGSDKLHHFLAFAALAFPIALSRPRHLVIALPAIMAFGGMIELMQPFFGRTAEFADLIADGAGTLAGAVSGIALRAVLLRRVRQADDTAPETR